MENRFKNMYTSGPEKKNILVLVEHAGQGGAEKVAAVLAQALAENKSYRVHYCALYRPAQLPQIPGVVVSTLGIETGGGLRGRIARYGGVISRLRRFKKQHHIALTISNLWPADWVNRFCGREGKIAVIHTTILHSQYNRLMVKAHRLVSAVYRGFDKVVLVSGNLTTELADFFRIPASKLQVVYNPVNNAQAAQLAAETPMPALEKLFSEHQVLTAINRLSPGKNTEALIRIYRLLKPTGAKLLVVGEGAEKPALEAAMEAAGLTFMNLSADSIPEDKDIYFAPFQQNVFAIFKRATLFLFPTRGEGLPLVLLEAMSCGCLTLASDCPNGGVSEIMQSKTPFNIQQPRTEAEKATGGYLLPIPEGLASDALWVEKIKELLSLDKAAHKDLIGAAQQRAADFDIHHFSRQWQELVKNVLNA